MLRSRIFYCNNLDDIELPNNGLIPMGWYASRKWKVVPSGVEWFGTIVSVAESHICTNTYTIRENNIILSLSTVSMSDLEMTETYRIHNLVIYI